ncbi:MAG: WecB/TagA/CpsF family glycosyltransferase, partial [Opitutales bacterium]
MTEPFHTVRILGLRFYNDSLERALDLAHTGGGLFLAPSGPGLADLGTDPAYDEAALNADLNLIDSGYLALLWKRRTGEQIRRHSGLKFIKALIEDERFQSDPRQLWVMPSQADIESARHYLRENGLDGIDSRHFYEAPYYRDRPVRDETLLERIRDERPDYVILCIAGGKQEVLGHWLRERLEHRPAIICIG